MHNTSAHHPQLMPSQSPKQQQLPSQIFAQNDAIWYEISLWPVWAGCPGHVPSQPTQNNYIISVLSTFFSSEIQNTALHHLLEENSLSRLKPQEESYIINYYLKILINFHSCIQYSSVSVCLVEGLQWFIQTSHSGRKPTLRPTNRKSWLHWDLESEY